MTYSLSLYRLYLKSIETNASCFRPVTFQGLSGHLWLMDPAVASTTLEFQGFWSWAFNFNSHFSLYSLSR